MLLFLPLFALVQMIHWLGFLLDELFYRGYRDVTLEQPVFILGVPRSGTTFLHRVLSDHNAFTTFSTWECFFAPSITQRRFWLGLGKLDAKIGRPLQRSLDWIQTRLLSGLDGIHATRMDAAEEDYLTLLPILSSFILVLPFPHADSIWRMGSFDRDMPATERDAIMKFYRAMLQKHLYVHGPDKRLLSKNAAFASLADGLSQTFPDARFFCCLRDPLEALPSQLSSIQAGIVLFDAESQGPVYQQKMLELFEYYYQHLLDSLPQHAADRVAFINMQNLQTQLYSTLLPLLNRFDISVSQEFLTHLQAQDERSKRYTTAHRYSPASVGLSAADLHTRFAPVYARYDFGAALESQELKAQESDTPSSSPDALATNPVVSTDSGPC